MEELAARFHASARLQSDLGDMESSGSNKQLQF